MLPVVVPFDGWRAEIILYSLALVATSFRVRRRPTTQGWIYWAAATLLAAFTWQTHWRLRREKGSQRSAMRLFGTRSPTSPLVFVAMAVDVIVRYRLTWLYGARAPTPI